MREYRAVVAVVRRNRDAMIRAIYHALRGVEGIRAFLEFAIIAAIVAGSAENLDWTELRMIGLIAFAMGCFLWERLALK